MSTQSGALFDSEAIDVMRRALDEAMVKLLALRSGGHGDVHPKSRKRRRAECTPLAHRSAVDRDFGTASLHAKPPGQGRIGAAWKFECTSARPARWRKPSIQSSGRTQSYVK
jgi:hypothetical protein